MDGELGLLTVHAPRHAVLVSRNGQDNATTQVQNMEVLNALTVTENWPIARHGDVQVRYFN